MLLRELQHRTKNNFQIILAILSLKGRHATPDTRERLGRVMDRIHAIALAHDLLSMKEGGSSVEFDRYLRALCANIDPHRDQVTIELEAAPTVLPLDRAVPIGLIVNELVTNSLKHAFDEQGGVIRVRFTVEHDAGEGCLTVEDDGKGIQAGDSSGLGFSLIDAFAQQLQGRMEREPVEKGSRTTLRFPLAI
jgi:two-component sensor histidine kinase